MNQWKDICKIDDILPETGVCALLGDEQVLRVQRAVTRADCGTPGRAVGRQPAEKTAFSLK